MPRRKVTRAAKTKKTSRVSDENEVEISNKEREKLETYLKDFDTRVERKLQLFEQTRSSLFKKFRCFHQAEKLNLGKTVLEMTLGEYAAKLTDFQTEVEKENVETDDPEMEAEDELFPDLPASVRRHFSRAKASNLNIQDTIMEDDVFTENGNKTNKRALPESGFKKFATVRNCMPPPSPSMPFKSRFLGSAQKKFQTPANRTLADAGWCNTPLVTPKFDPRVPLTPADTRRARPGEILMSMDGSPVQSNSHSRAYSFNVKQKRNTVTLDIQLPEESEKAEIETLPHEEKLTAIINVLSQALKEGKSGQ
ncbi:borealin-like [Crassostrea virginica]|uniref:Borealin-like n=1 Tax=Crassostrea virginica TaxID=6565 RepID=A0A8B8E7L4_CRAVI|nr:borealin-like [Crassostrea virginica]